MWNTHLSMLQSLYLASSVTSSEIWDWISYTNSNMQNTQAQHVWKRQLMVFEIQPHAIAQIYHHTSALSLLIKMSPSWLSCNFMERVRCWGFWSSYEDWTGCKNLPPELAYHRPGHNKFIKPYGNALNCSHCPCSINFKRHLQRLHFMGWGWLLLNLLAITSLQFKFTSSSESLYSQGL